MPFGTRGGDHVRSTAVAFTTCDMKLFGGVAGTNSNN